MVGIVGVILPVVPGFARAVVTPGGAVADPTFFDRLYAYAWFVTFGLSFVAFLGLTRPNCLTTEAQRSQRKTRTLWVCCFTFQHSSVFSL